MQYLIEKDQPYKGYVTATVEADGTVGWSGGKTVAEYEADRGRKFTVISEDELDALTAQFEKSMITVPEAITEDRYWEMLEVMPPSRFGHNFGIEMFHVCEHITGDLVNWFAKVGDKYFAAVNTSQVDRKTLADIFKAAAEQTAPAAKVLAEDSKAE
jgi:hypothetical protein